MTYEKRFITRFTTNILGKYAKLYMIFECYKVMKIYVRCNNLLNKSFFVNYSFTEYY